MKQTIVLLIKNKDINKIRKKYDVHSKFKTHLTLVYPFQVKDQKKLYSHIKKITAKFKPFEVIFNKLSSSDEYIRISASADGELMKLYRHLNSGVLSGFKNPELQIYTPHVSLAVLEDENKRDEVVGELRKKSIKFKEKISSLQLLTLKENDSINSIKNFGLGQ